MAGRGGCKRRHRCKRWQSQRLQAGTPGAWPAGLGCTGSPCASRPARFPPHQLCPPQVHLARCQRGVCGGSGQSGQDPCAGAWGVPRGEAMRAVQQATWHMSWPACAAVPCRTARMPRAEQAWCKACCAEQARCMACTQGYAPHQCLPHPALGPCRFCSPREWQRNWSSR